MKYSMLCAAVLGIGMLLSRSGHSLKDQELKLDRSEMAACENFPSQSRWQTTGQQIVKTSRFGQEPEVLLDRVLGLVTTPAGEVVVYDGPSKRVHILDDKLNRKSSFGREGQGPGELQDGMTLGLNGAYTMVRRIGAGGSTIVVSDGFRMQGYTHDGSYQEILLTGGSGLSAGLGLVGLQPIADGVVYGVDSVYFSQPLRRTLATWLIRAGRRRLVHSLPLTDPPRIGSSAHFDARQARPLWSALGACIIVGDGESSRLLRIDAETRRVDTLALPEHEVPPYSAKKGSGISGPMSSIMKQQGIPVEVMEAKEPTALQRWAEISVDPDGHIWLNPWRPESERGSPMEIYRIDPSGRAHRESVPAFPVAFGAPGVFYAVERNPDTDEVMVVRYQRR